MRKIMIAGRPNVGKSVLFNNLTKSYVNVSNYPGTTVEVYRGQIRIGDEDFEVIDTPGMYSLIPITEEEKVARKIIFDEHLTVLLHMVDAKNVEQMLPLTLQFMEAGLPVILVLNIMDEAEQMGMYIDIEKLKQELNIPVVAAVSTTGKGIDILKGQIEEYAHKI
ncbi:MAG: FeoB small GTPase domain-containing protein [Candidatus Omnitrophota bacterium]